MIRKPHPLAQHLRTSFLTARKATRDGEHVDKRRRIGVDARLEERHGQANETWSSILFWCRLEATSVLCAISHEQILRFYYDDQDK